MQLQHIALICRLWVVMQELKNRTRIYVNQAAVLIGTMDELGVLQDGEIFVQIAAGPLQESPRIITGHAIVTKNPAFHPGDIRKLKVRQGSASLAIVMAFDLTLPSSSATGCCIYQLYNLMPRQLLYIFGCG